MACDPQRPNKTSEEILKEELVNGVFVNSGALYAV